jgi:hypothetical protein
LPEKRRERGELNMTRRVHVKQANLFNMHDMKLYASIKSKKNPTTKQLHPNSPILAVKEV